MDFKTIDDIDLNGKRVIVRVDFNVPQKDEGTITDDFRIKKAIPTIQEIIDKGASQVILMSHLGDPKSEENKYRLDEVGKRLETLIKQPVIKLSNCVDIEIPKDKIILLENLRFHPQEKMNDDVFSQKLASHADIYVNDAFGTCHRAHASVVGITKHLPSVAGRLVQKEVEMLNVYLPHRPFIAILGAAKIGDKIEMIENLLHKVDYLLLGGAIVFNFLKAQGLEIGKSLHEEEHIQTAKSLLGHPKIVIPKDIVVASEIKEGVEVKTVKINEIPTDMIGLDVGEETIIFYKQLLSSARTIFWNGPLGMFELKPFDKATKEVAEHITTLNNCLSIVGGGDTANAVRSMGLENGFSHVSTGGGASIEMVQGITLPGIQALIDNKKN